METRLFRGSTALSIADGAQCVTVFIARVSDIKSADCDRKSFSDGFMQARTWSLRINVNHPCVCRVLSFRAFGRRESVKRKKALFLEAVRDRPDNYGQRQ